jgi:hypothetical protein
MIIDLKIICHPTGEIMGLRPAKVIKNAFCRATPLQGSATFPFVIPSVPGFPASGTGESSVCGFL